MAAFTSSQLGWNPASANINSQLLNFINNLSASGDSLHLEGLFKVNVASGWSRPIWKGNFTITADDGCGFDFIGTNGTNSAGEFFRLTNVMTLDNVLCQASQAPETNYQGNNPTLGTDHHRGTMWDAQGKRMIVRSCTFKDNVEQFIEFSGPNALDIRNTHFRRGKSGIGCQGGSTNVYIYQTLFDDSMVDAIKTVNGAGNTAVNTGWVIDDCIFQGSRDGIDLTGGLENSSITNTIFRNLNVCALDAKILIEADKGTNLSSYAHAVCKNIVFTNCDVYDTSSVFVLTFLNKDGLTYNYAFQEALTPQYITWTGGEFVRTTARPTTIGQRVLLDKMGHHCSWSGIRRGAIVPPDDDISTDDNGEEQDGWNSHHNTVTFTSTISTRPAPDNSVHFVYGQGGVPPDDPEEPEIPPAPVSAGEAFVLNAATGVLTVKPSLASAFMGKTIAARVTTGFGTDDDEFTITEG